MSNDLSRKLLLKESIGASCIMRLEGAAVKSALWFKSCWLLVSILSVVLDLPVFRIGGLLID